MNAPTTTRTDPVRMLDALDADALAQRIDAIDRERSALLVLLRAVRRARPRGRRAASDETGVRHAS